MSTPTNPPEFPERTSEPLVQTYPMSNVVKDAGSQSGRDVLTIINGGNQQISMLSEHWLSDTPVDAPPLFVIQARNQIQFGGQTISVINDALTYAGKSLAPSNPTATEYFAQVGKQVFIKFSCALVKEGSAAWTTYRAAKFGNLDKPLYVVRQTSFILP
jgi:hypothetical protein